MAEAPEQVMSDADATNTYLAKQQAASDDTIARAYLEANPDRAKAYGVTLGSAQPAPAAVDNRPVPHATPDVAATLPPAGTVTGPFTDEGPQYYNQAFQRNQPFAKPGPYTTTLSPDEEQQFRQWLSSSGNPSRFDPNAQVTDYDMRGYWKDVASKGGSQTAINPTDQRLHWPDTYKTPYDTTFSAESKYAQPGAPLKWVGDQLVNTDTGQVMFRPGQQEVGPPESQMAGNMPATERLARMTAGPQGAIDVARDLSAQAQNMLSEFRRTMMVDPRDVTPELQAKQIAMAKRIAIAMTPQGEGGGEGEAPAPPSAAQTLAQKQIDALKEARVGETTAAEFGRPDIATVVPEAQTMREGEALRAQLEPFESSDEFPQRPPMAAQTAALAKTYQDEAFGIRDAALDIQRRGAAGEDVTQDAAALHDRFAAYAVNYANLAGTRSEAGRALQILDPLKPGNLFAADTAKLAQELAADPSSNLIDKLAAVDPNRAAVLARELGEATIQGRSVTGMIREYYMNALLSKPSTFVAKKVLGDITSYALAVPTRYIASKIPAWGEAAPLASQEASAFATSSAAAMSDALRIADLTFRNGTSAVDALGGAEAGPFEPGMELPQIRGDGTDNLVNNGMDLLGNVIRLPSRTIQAETDFWHVMNFRGQIGALAYRNATQEAAEQGLEGEAAGQFIEQRAAELANNPTPEMTDAAHSFAREQTYLKPLGPAAQAFNTFLNKLPAGMGRVLFPFRMVPINIAKFATGYSPLALLARSVRADLSAGGAAGQLAAAKIGMGTAAMALFGTMAMDGHVTGGGPSDPTQFRNQLATGWKPYSIRVGDNYYSYDRLDPIGIMLGIPADFITLMQQAPANADDGWSTKINQAAVATALTLGRNSTRQSYVQTLVNINGLIDSLRSGSTMEEGLQKFGAQEISGLVPAVVRGEARREDPVARDTRGFMDTLLAQIPGYSKSLPPRRDLEANPILVPPGFLANEVYPFQIGAENNNPVAREIFETGASPQKPPDVLPGTGPRTATQRYQGAPGDDVGVPLDKYQKDRWQVLRATLKDPDAGTMTDALKTAIADPDYQQLQPQDKATVLEKIVLAYGKAATAQLIDEDKTLQQKYQYRMQYKALSHAPPGTSPATLGLEPVVQ
jgi:hypothetical protein